MDNVEQKYDSIPEELIKLLKEGGHPNPEFLKDCVAPEAYTATTAKEQRFYTNRALRPILGDMPLEELGKTREARACLIDTMCETVDYLRLFKEHVVPCLIENELPRHKTN